MNISAENIRTMSRTSKSAIVDGIVGNQQFIEEGGINTPLRLCHFMAQCAHESAHFGTTLEFASGKAYEGRKDLGNVRVGDGERYRGRGLIQTTGRANYREARNDIRKIKADAPDFEADPAALQDFPWALLSAVSYWRRRKLNRHADRDDLEAMTRGVNGGRNGIESRRMYLARAKAIWMERGVASVAGPVLRPGSRGQDVIILQNALIGAGFRVFADGQFGDFTAAAVNDFQERNGLGADGIVGARTWAMLRARGA